MLLKGPWTWNTVSWILLVTWPVLFLVEAGIRWCSSWEKMVASWTTVWERVLFAPTHWGEKMDLKNQLYWGIIVRQWNSLILSMIWFLLKNVYNFDSLITIALSVLEYDINSHTVYKKETSHCSYLSLSHPIVSSATLTFGCYPFSFYAGWVTL